MFDLTAYYASLNSNNFPIENSVKLSDEDNLRRTVIQDIRNYFEVDKKSIASQFEIEFDKHFNEEIINLQKYVTDGLVIMSEEKILITSIGEQFANLIASTFDTYIVQN